MSKSSRKKPTVGITKSKPAERPLERQVSTRSVQSKIDVPAKQAEAKAVFDEPKATQGFTLIRFDKRLKWFLGICITLFFLLTLANINTSSVAIWNQILPDGSSPQRGLISGQPRSIRMDDYAVGIPWIISQSNKGYPLENETIGGQKAPVLTTPTPYFTILFRPTNWGYFIFDVDRGFAWGVNLTIFLSLVSMTLMLLLLTGNNFWLSVFGGIWILLSSGTQSWFYNAMHAVPGACLLFVSAAYLLYAVSQRQIWLAALAAGWSFTNFALILYPPYQIPLAYAIGLLFLGYVINNAEWELVKTKWPFMLAGGVLVLGIIGLTFYTFFSDLKPTLDAVTGTVYPGKRSELGGTGFVANWFSEYYSWLVSDARFPKSWLNHCELSHYITFAPLILPFIGLSFFQNRKIDWTLLLLSVYIILMYVWIEVGFPEALAKATLLNMSPTRRAQIPFGIANVLLTVIYLNYLRKNPLPRQQTLTWVSALAVIGYMVYTASVNVNDGDGFFKWHQLFIPIIFFVGLGLLLIPTWPVSYRVPIFCVGITVFLLPNLRLNPIAKGLSPITDHALYRTVQSIHQQEPKARWVVFGSQYISYMVTATGVDLLSGVKYTPPRTIYNVLDPQMKRDSAYNRYAHTVYNTFINGTDSVYIQNTFEDACVVAMDPCSPKFKQLNVKYIIFDHQTQPVETRCMKLVSTLGSLQIFRIND